MAGLFDILFQPLGSLPGWVVGSLFIAAFVAIALLIRRTIRRNRPLKGPPVPEPMLTPPEEPARQDIAGKLVAELGMLSAGSGGRLQSAERMGRIAALHRALGNGDDATLYRQAAVERFREEGVSGDAIQAQIEIAHFCQANRFWDDAAFWYERAQRGAEQGSDPGLIAHAAGGVALVHYWKGDYRDALSRLMVAQLALGEKGYDRQRAWFHEIKGAVEAALGRIEAARQDYRRSARLYRAIGASDQAAPVHKAAGDLYHHAGDIPGACAEWALARDLYAKQGDLETAQDLDRRIHRLTHRTP